MLRSKIQSFTMRGNPAERQDFSIWKNLKACKVFMILKKEKSPLSPESGICFYEGNSLWITK